MNSLEALEKLLDLITIYSYWVEAHSYCNTIKQDLERKEQLEKEYKLLDETMEADDRIICQLSEEKEQLEKENIELKEQLKLSNESQETVINTMNLVSQENEKLKKAIAIIKPFLDIYAGEVKGYIDCCAENPIITFDLYNDEEFEEYFLLKEVLGE